MSGVPQARIKEIAVAAVELPAEERAAFLNRACGADVTLRREVESLLAQEGRTPALMRTGAVEKKLESALGAGPLPDASAREGAGFPSAIGPFRVFEVLGEGGMGTVYRAEQTEPIRREVALKVIRTGMDTAGILARFEAERQTMAQMDHPNIARVLDAGSDEQGRPWFAMELVRGIGITDYCRSNAVDARHRVRLFLGVCRAVRHAHRRGIIHRDLKPSNILVTIAGGEPVPKVIDFSIAKALGDPALGTEHRTQTGQVMGTLEYMSPEQARGAIGEIDTRSDLYSLGVVLHEMVTGRLPVEVKGLPLHEAVRRIVEDPPASLGRTLPGTTRGSRSIDADVVTILEKCLEKDPERRYGSAAELTEDVERYLDSRPILARPPTTGYQLRKLIGRHRVAAGVTALVFTFLVTFGATVAVQLGIQSRERARAEAAARKAERTVTFLREMLAAANPEEMGRDATVREVLDRAAETLDVDLKSEPEVLADLHATMAKTYESLGEYATGLEHADRALELLGAGGNTVAEERGKVMAARAILLSHLGRHTEARESAAESLRILESRLGPDHPATVESAMVRTSVEAESGEIRRAYDLGRDAMERSGRAFGPESDEHIRTMLVFGVILAQQGGTEYRDEAREILERTLALGRQQFGDRHPVTVDSMVALANFHAGEGLYPEGAALLREALAARRELYGEGTLLVAEASNDLAVAYMQNGQIQAASPLAAEATRIWREKLGDHTYLVSALQNQGYLLMGLDETSAAEAAFREALDVAARIPDRKTLPLHLLYSNLGYLLGRVGRPDEGLALMDRALSADLEKRGANAPFESYIAFLKGTVLLSAGRVREAEPLLRQFGELVPDFDYVGLAESKMGPRGAASALGRALAAQGRREEAETYLSLARPWLLSGASWPHVKRHELSLTADLYEGWGENEMASRYRSALVTLEDEIRREPEPAAAGLETAAR